MTNPVFPGGAIPPFVPRDDQDPVEELAVREVDGEQVLDEDAAADLIDSADADRLASSAEPDD